MILLPHDSLTCGICYDLLNSPYECNGCHNLFCEECLNLYLTTKDKFKRIYFCPICRNKKNNFSKNLKIENILEKYKNSDKKLCPKCLGVFEHEKYNNHINKCWIKCQFCKELFHNENKFLKHFTKNKNHDLSQIVNKFNRKANLFENKTKSEERKNSEHEQIKREKFENNLDIKKSEEEEKDFILIDREGYNVKYDLYFCGKNNGINCKCCESRICCPSGEICPQCMKKNLEFHELKGYYLINKSGKACKYSHGSFHCYSKFENIVKDIGGNYFKEKKICSKNYTCEACKNITKLMNYYLSTHTIKKLFERDNKAEKNSLKVKINY